MNIPVPIIIPPSKQPVTLNLNIDLSKSMPHLFPPKDAILIDQRIHPTSDIGALQSVNIFKLKTGNYECVTITYVWFKYHTNITYSVQVNNQEVGGVGESLSGMQLIPYGYSKASPYADLTAINDILRTILYIRKSSELKIYASNNHPTTAYPAEAYIKGWKWIES